MSGRDKIAVMIMEATGWRYTRALRFRRNEYNRGVALSRAKRTLTTFPAAMVELAMEAATRCPDPETER